MVLDTYGKSTGFCIDPIEKKPLNHFLPGTPVLSFGTAGCNLGCKFCQNWDISKSREVTRLSDSASPAAIAQAAKQAGCRSVAFTYNDPIIWAEYAIDTAKACHEIGLKSVAVTAGYITPQARGEFFASMDAANIDLKAFTEKFYHQITGAHLQPILDTIDYVCNQTDCWVELTNLMIPQANDGDDEVKRMCDWVLETVGADVPVHFTAFHPDFKMTDRPRTSHETLIMAYELARSAGLRYVYVGNVHDVQRQSTYCPECGELLIQRDWHQLGHYALKGDRCGQCQATIAGHFENVPGDWGRKRQPIRIQSIQPSSTQEPQMPPANTDVLSFSDSDQRIIHNVACQLVRAAVHHEDNRQALEELGDLIKRPVSGVYVTLKRGETLRGCCGLQGNPMPLAEALASSAHRTATQDPRMPAISPIEINFLELTVSILGPTRPINVRGDACIEAVKVGSHGLRIRLGEKVGLLLPSVAVERDWDSRQFLDAVCRKAGLPAGAWRSDDVVLEIFDGVAVSEPMSSQQTAGNESPILSAEDTIQLSVWVRSNLNAIQSGAMPFYYATGVSDVNANGVILQVDFNNGREPLSLLQLNLREGMPLQSTLYEMTQQAAKSLGQTQLSSDSQVGIAILSHAVHHGPFDEADTRGVQPNDRATLLTDGRHWAVRFDPNASVSESITTALNTEAFRKSSTQVYSLQCSSSESNLTVSIGPRAQPAITSRPPAVAGSFYPADSNEREAQVDELLAGMAVGPNDEVSAIMVPHAGLRFSGQIAAKTWRQIKIPDSVLIIGPKHTADGVDWAVAPHDRWHLSSTESMTGAADLAKRIASNVSGMQLDSIAHAREHSIEIQLPLLYRLAPTTKIAAIAMAGGSISELESAAESLASLLASMENPPLLVISSDMNHFADDAENRRRDRIALDAMKSLDAQQLIKTCNEQNISMCGVVPAALVMLTLQALGTKMNYREIGYATSADTTGDRSRVVGYAGVLL